MTTYIITEKQNLQSIREGEAIQAKSLTAAKRKARSMQCFFGTVLTIESEAGHMLAHAKDGQQWVNS